MTLTDTTATSPVPSGTASSSVNPVKTSSTDFYLPDDNVSSLTEQLYGHHLQPCSQQHQQQQHHPRRGSSSHSNLNAVVAPQNMAKLRRDSIAHSQGMGGVSWGSLSIGSWLRDEVMFHTNSKNSRSNSISRHGSINLQSTNAIPTGTSRRPSHYRASASPPSAYNSYLPNLEKQYCKDYSCCGLSLPGLHDLLRHYEEAHIATSPGSSTANILQNNSNANLSTQRRKAYQNSSQLGIPKQNQQHQQQQKSSHQNIIQQQLHQRGPQQHTPPSSQQPQQHSSRIATSPSTIGTTHTNINITSTGHNSTNATTTTSTNPNSSLSQAPQLHLNGNLVDAVSTNDVFLQATNTAQLSSISRRHDESQNSMPQHSYQNNGKIPITPQHSFNTYSLNMPSTKSSQNHHSKMNNVTAHNQMSGSNGNQSKTLKFPTNVTNNGMEFDFMHEDFAGSDFDDNTPAFMRMGSTTISHPHHNPLIGSNSKNSMMSRVHHPTPPPSSTIGVVAPHIMHDEDEDEDDEEDEEDEDDDLSAGASNLSQAKNSDNNINRQEGYIHDPARRLYVMDHEEHKPFKCPVIGCDKTYKNQNGLKYHKLHGHQNQKLHENSDGTFSIIDPESNEPYPDGMGYEKDKPYRCEVCGKRYKNLNGLKYHRGHSTH